MASAGRPGGDRRPKRPNTGPDGAKEGRGAGPAREPAGVPKASVEAVADAADLLACAISRLYSFLSRRWRSCWSVSPGFLRCALAWRASAAAAARGRSASGAAPSGGAAAGRRLGVICRQGAQREVGKGSAIGDDQETQSGRGAWLATEWSIVPTAPLRGPRGQRRVDVWPHEVLETTVTPTVSHSGGFGALPMRTSFLAPGGHTRSMPEIRTRRQFNGRLQNCVSIVVRDRP